MHILYFFLLLFMLFLQRYLFSSNAVKEILLSDDYNAYYLVYKKILFGITKTIPFSIGDVLYILLLFLFLYKLFLVLKHLLIKKKLLFKNTIFILLFINFFYFSYHLLWGFQYNKQFIYTHFFVDDTNENELKEMAVRFLEKSKSTREQTCENENGVFKVGLIDAELEKELKNTWKKSNKNMRFQNIGVIKPSLFSSFLSYFGIGGYYNPFTNEANYNNTVPETKKVFNIAHELAHQSGFSYEKDANFIAFFNCYNSKSKPLNYVSNLVGLKYTLQALYYKDSLFVDSLVANYSEGMQRDREFEILHKEKYKSDGIKYFRAFNNAFLKSNKQEKGVKSYSDLIFYLVGLNREGYLD